MEVVVTNVEASRASLFARFGLTDAALMEVVSPMTLLLTVDLNLYPPGCEAGPPRGREIQASATSLARRAGGSP